MLIGINALLSNPPSPETVSVLQQMLITHQQELAELHCVEGSLKKVYQLPAGNLALACFREKESTSALSRGKALLEKEKKLVAMLGDLGLPTVKIYGEPFEIKGQFALLMDWVNDATLIDVKDQEAACQKLVATLLNVTIPSGEGWVLQKSSIEKKISDKFKEKDFSHEAVKAQAKKFQQQFAEITTILAQKGFMIADLQLLINAEGVKIIDPIDIVMTITHPSAANSVEYQSLLDESRQTNTDFIKLLYDGKRMLQQCLTFCETLSGLSTKAELEQQMLAFLKPKEAQSPRAQEALPLLLLRKKAAPAKRAITSLKNIIVSHANENQVEEQQAQKGSPEKKPRQAPDSPTKLLAFQFRVLKSNENESANTPSVSAAIERPSIL
ncbi:MAG: hypothetical protein AB7I18_06330 [Candidatus Berkiella sp.]